MTRDPAAIVGLAVAFLGGLVVVAMVLAWTAPQPTVIDDLFAPEVRP